jgi:hypothetical protein
MLTSRDTPLKRAENWISSLLIVRLRGGVEAHVEHDLAVLHVLHRHRVRSSTRTLRYGV